MSPKSTGSWVYTKGRYFKSRPIMEGSDKKYSGDRVESDSEAGSDSASGDDPPQRVAVARVGLRGDRSRKHTTAEKLAARVIKQPNGCWEVQGAALHSGHVQICVPMQTWRGYGFVRAHVFAWEQANGKKVPKGLVVMHACDHPRCVNPDHLSVGTQRDNILDSIRKGRYNVFGHQKLNAEQVHQIRDLSASGMRQKDIAARFGIARNTVSGIVCRKSWAHLPFVHGGNQSGEPPEPKPVDQPNPLDLPNSPFELVPSREVAILGDVR